MTDEELDEIFPPPNLKTKDPLAAAYAEGFRDGAEAMRDVFWQEAMRLNWSPSASAKIRIMPLPEMKQ